jgi:predicted dehydrogenase
MTAVTLGIVGCGRLAEAGYVPALEHVDGARVVAVADPDAARRARVAQLAADGASGRPITAHEDLVDLLAARAPDALILASPVGHHLDHARIASAARIPTLLEKPPARDAAGARAIAELDPLPWIAFNRRFEPGAARARHDVAGHRDLELHFELTYRRRSWAPVQVHDDALLDLGPHLVDWARWVTGGELDDVRALDLRAERAVLAVRTPKGRATLTAATDSNYRERIEARAPDGQLVTRYRRGGRLDTIRGRLPWVAHPLVATLAAELTELVRVVRGGAPERLGTAADGCAVMQALDAARASFARR